MMQIVNEPDEMQKLALELRRQGKSIGLVPTMGCLHEGHLSLIRLAEQETDVVIVSIFVNPTQFGPREDLNRYPQPFAEDCRLCRENKVEILFHPAPEGMYPEDFSTWINEEKLSRGLCGQSRPGHFRGVTTVVTKLFNLTQPELAVFGAKDAQQALVIRRMTKDLNLPVRIKLAPTVREPDGLALSSRNRYLNPEQRQRALALYRGLESARAVFAAGCRQAELLKKHVSERIVAVAADIDYVELVDLETLEPVVEIRQPALLAVAAFFGGTRLIDNIFLSPEKVNE